MVNVPSTVQVGAVPDEVIVSLVSRPVHAPVPAPVKAEPFTWGVVE
jgi:hypothetical protein